jgi:endoglucanase
MRMARSPWTVGALSIAVAGVLTGLTVSGPPSQTGVIALAQPTATSVATAPGAWTAEPDPPAPTPTPSPSPSAAGPVSVAGLHVKGNQIVNADGVSVRLLGFNSSGAEYACMEGWGIFDGPLSYRTRMPASAVRRMAAWTGANTVRVPLNEQCWLGIGVKPAYGGAAYRKAIKGYVHQLLIHGFAVVLDLHRSAPANGRSLKQEQMPDRDHSLTFWRQVAKAYKHNTSIVFDLFNEPWPYGEVNSARAWTCWRDGGCTLRSTNTGAPYTAAGMNEIIAAIRSTGARNVLAVGGIHWAETLNQWLDYRPRDPRNNLVASFHNYAYNHFCRDLSCYDTVLAQVSASVPLYAGEIGPDTVNDACTPSSVGRTGFSKRVLDWLDAHRASYTPWTWNAWRDCYSLVSSYRGGPTPVWGKQIKARLAANRQ